jgi:hypothetical protein
MASSSKDLLPGKATSCGEPHAVDHVLARSCDQQSVSKEEVDPWHCVPVLARKPGALRNGAPVKDWVLPAAMDRVQRRLAGADDGNRQMVDILTAVLRTAAEAIAHGVHSADVILNILARQPRSASQDPHAGGADAAPRTRSRSCPLRQPQENHLMGRTQLFDLMGELKLYGMKDAFDEIIATAVKRQHEPSSGSL